MDIPFVSSKFIRTNLFLPLKSIMIMLPFRDFPILILSLESNDSSESSSLIVFVPKDAIKSVGFIVLSIEFLLLLYWSFSLHMSTKARSDLSLTNNPQTLAMYGSLKSELEALLRIDTGIFLARTWIYKYNLSKVK